MKRPSTLTTGSITALATIGLGYNHGFVSDAINSTSHQVATDESNLVQDILTQAIVFALGPVDTVSAETAGGATEEQPPTSTITPPAGEHSGTRIEDDPDYIPPAPAADNPFIEGSGDNCVTVALPISGTEKKYCGDEANGGVILVYIKEMAKLLSGSIGGVIVLMIVISGIQYILSTGNPSRVQAAKIA
ncbi:hypothetical protein IPG36_04670 [bacterium]|nr:MAG: hypothetical protein IPG36_04670 [bacterium]